MEIKDATVGFAITGSFCTYKKVFPEIERLSEKCRSVVPIMSEKSCSTDTRFGRAADFVDRFEKLYRKGGADRSQKAPRRAYRRALHRQYNIQNRKRHSRQPGNARGKIASSQQPPRNNSGFDQRRAGRERQKHRLASRSEKHIFCPVRSGRCV